jgi:hypothetical protein
VGHRDEIILHGRTNTIAAHVTGSLIDPKGEAVRRGS